MGVLSTAAGNKLIEYLFDFTGISFEKKCYEYLCHFIPDLKESFERKKADRFGVDIYKLSETSKYDYEMAFQCKGFEERFEQSQLNQCLNSLNVLTKSNKRIKHFYFIINLKSKYFNLSLRRQLEMELKSLEKRSNVVHTYLMDLGDFVEYLGKLMNASLNKQIIISNRRFAKDYKQSMRQRFYLEDIPFELSGKILTNPLKYIRDKIFELQPTTKRNAKNVKKLWFFIISEFGFGKTSLLIKLLDEFKKESFNFIYVPASLLSKHDFMYGANFANRLLEIVSNQKLDFSDPFNKLMAKVLSQSLEVETSRLILLIDGLDEQDILFDNELLKIFFNNITNYKCKVLFTLRKEMWDERYGNFQSAIGKTNSKNKLQIFLEEWQTKTILSYLDSIINTKPNKNIEGFKKLVETNQYEEFYGDIPRRPLFLEMIVSDVKANAIQKRNISELYFNYLRNKFIRDRQGTSSAYSPKRPLSFNEDINKSLSLIFTALDKIALSMVIVSDKNNVLHLTNYVSEKEVKEIIDSLGITKTVEFMLNSVLVSAGVRNDDNLQLRFAHKSFQEFFIARGILLHIRSYLRDSEKIPDMEFIHQDGINQFLLGFIDNELTDKDIKKLKNNISKNYQSLSEYSVGNFILNIKQKV